jgi:NAD-dependent deacetylase
MRPITPLVRLEEFAAPTFHLVAQNIDDLHQRAGSSRITALHGELTKARHMRTGHAVPCCRVLKLATMPSLSMHT